MLTRNRSMPVGLNEAPKPNGKSPNSDVHDVTVIPYVNNSSPVVNPCLLASMPVFHAVPAPPCDDSVEFRPQAAGGYSACRQVGGMANSEGLTKVIEQHGADRMSQREIELTLRVQELEIANLKAELYKIDSSVESEADRQSSGVSLPKIETLSFDGSPLDYWSFKRSFEVNIASRVRDEAQRFNFLLFYCRGKARDVIKGCAVLDYDMGYSEAWRLLERHFGRPYRIVRAMLDGILEGGQIREDLESIQTLARKMRECLISLTQMGRVRDLDVEANLLTLVKRMPTRLQDKWATKAGRIHDEGREPVFADLLELVEKRISAMDNVYGQALSKSSKPPQQVFQRPPLRVSAVLTSRLPPCSWCHGDAHGLGACKKFAEAPVQERREFIWRNRRCFRCLNAGHLSTNCRSNLRCAIDTCNGGHHTLLHVEKTPESITSRVNSNVTTPTVRLGFIPVVIKNQNVEITTNALIDNGSDISLITKKLAKRLRLTGEACNLKIRTLHGTRPAPSERVCISLGSIDGEFGVEAAQVFTVDGLPCTSVDGPVDLARWSHLRDVIVESLPDSEVGMLIGCDMPQAHWVMDQRIGKSDEPHAVLTPFGWTVRGNMGGSRLEYSSVNCMSTETLTTEESLEVMYRREFMWSNDDESEAPSKEDARALSIVEKSTAIVNGRYEVGVPWKRDDPRLPDNYSLAHRRATFLKKRLLRDGDLLAKYQDAISSYIKKEYISVVEGDHEVKRWYLPHHPVINPRKPSKVRIVFDCAAKFQNRSLNDELLSGPNLNNDLAGVLVRFREGAVATAADIEEMFLRVRLPEEDKWAFSFLWWTNDRLLGEPKVFQWNVHPFGATSSPFCAAYALRKVADGVDLSEPCKRAIRDNFYVDDCLLASVSTNVASLVAKRLRNLLEDVGFRLTKWVSNVPESLCFVPTEDQLPVFDCRDLVDKTSHSTLGLLWNMRRDTLEVDLQISVKSTTKRGVLATVASFFDPLGVMSPFLLPARIFLQRLCHQGLGWDSELDRVDKEWWSDWLLKIANMITLKIPRNFMPVTTTSLELHVFSDASESGYGVVAYLRSEIETGAATCNFVMGKARVVPRKSTTIPRLELTAAVLAVKLLTFLRKETRLPFAAAFLWTDSQIVLHYLRNTTRRFKTFVANRVGYVLENSRVDQWRHVPSADNPADLASRGLIKTSQTEIDLWLEGPAFLRLNSQDWPRTQLVDKDLEEDGEIRRVAVATANIERPSVLSKLLSQYSTWNGLVRGVAWLRRFIRYVVIMRLGSPDHALSLGRLEISELETSERKLVSLIQEDCFQTELSIMSSALIGKLKSSLARLKPVVRDGLICLGGRLPKALVILPQRHPAVDKLIYSYHEACGHMGATHVLANLRMKYWIVKGMSSVRRVLSKCIVCKTASARSCEQVMAPLPVVRIEKGGSPFLECGVDYFGPLEIKKGRTIHKRYGCLFTCLKTRAVHIEIAHTLSTDSFLMALIRFVGRRGIPNNLYSDNGSNFVGAEAELRRQVLELNQARISSGLTIRGIAWHFNPPHASHRGGVWERMIRTTRRVLSAVVKNQTLTEESLMTFMVEAERIVNDRPIAPLYDDPMAPVALRPNDLLLMRPNEGLPSVETNLLERYTKAWRQAQHLANMFWRRWQREYIPTLQLISKWKKDKMDLKVGDLVLLIGGVPTYGSWPKGIINDVHRGLDGHVRDVEIRTATGTVTRDIRSVCLLEAAFDVSE